MGPSKRESIVGTTLKTIPGETETPYCTFIVPLKVTCQILLSPLECTAGRTGLDPATSAVTALRELVLQQLTTTRGLQKYLQAVQDINFCGLGCGLEGKIRLPDPARSR